MREITPHGFEHNVRETLRFHDFDSDQLNRVRNIYDNALVEMKRHSLGAEHFNDALKHMESHPDWKHLSTGKQEAVRSAFKKHLGIADEGKTTTPQ